MDHMVNSLAEMESFNPSSVQDFLLSLSDGDQGYSGHHPQRPQIASPFTASNPNNFGVLDHHAAVPMMMNFDYSEANYFPPGGNSVPFSESERSGLRFPLTDKANGSSYSNCGEKKRRRTNDREAPKPKDVVHVRAKRGQATDSHSLAERLRREKINEKLRCLQDLVPGCYKTMGMAVMLDVIINYVRSLQNQIDFLSMKLSAASLYYDFNSSDDALGNMQVMHGYEAQGMDKVLLGEAYGALPQSHTTSWPL